MCALPPSRIVLLDSHITLFISLRIKGHKRVPRQKINCFLIAAISKHKFVVGCAKNFLAVVNYYFNEFNLLSSLHRSRLGYDDFAVWFAGIDIERFCSVSEIS